MKKEDPTYNPEEEDDALLQDDAYSDEEPAEAEPADEEPAGISLKEYIKEESREDERPQGTRLSLRKILGGDILYTQAIRKQIWLMLLIIGAGHAQRKQRQPAAHSRPATLYYNRQRK